MPIAHCPLVVPSPSPLFLLGPGLLFVLVFTGFRKSAHQFDLPISLYDLLMWRTSGG